VGELTTLKGGSVSRLPEIEPHTAAKHLLLKRYLDAWFPILGSRFNRIYYIDGFAGPGEYLGGQDGSPVIALKSALRHIETGTLSATVNVKFFFVEANPVFCTHLSRRVESLKLPETLSIEIINGEFREVIEPALDQLNQTQRALAPTFAFVDPFGFKGIPLHIMQRILRFRSCEVFVNVMVDFINRFLQHPNDKVVRHFPETFGSEDVLRIPEQPGDRKEALLELYRAQLKASASYVGRFDMENRRHRTVYSLFFATNSDKGFQKMKEAMWSVAPASGGLFSDADPRGLHAFTLFGTSALREQLVQQFGGETVPMEEIERFVTRKTDYLPKHAREQLQQLEKNGNIEVLSVPGHQRRAFTYPVGKVSIRFE